MCIGFVFIRYFIYPFCVATFIIFQLIHSLEDDGEWEGERETVTHTILEECVDVLIFVDDYI